VIDNGFHIVRALPHAELSIGTGAFAHDALDMRHFLLAPEFVYFGRDELK
jgi:hypothetical protein